MTLYYLLMDQPFHWPSRLALCIPARKYYTRIWHLGISSSFYLLTRFASCLLFQQRNALHLTIWLTLISSWFSGLLLLKYVCLRDSNCPNVIRFHSCLFASQAPWTFEILWPPCYRCHFQLHQPNIKLYITPRLLSSRFFQSSLRRLAHLAAYLDWWNMNAWQTWKKHLSKLTPPLSPKMTSLTYPLNKMKTRSQITRARRPLRQNSLTICGSSPTLHGLIGSFW